MHLLFPICPSLFLRFLCSVRWYVLPTIPRWCFWLWVAAVSSSEDPERKSRLETFQSSTRQDAEILRSWTNLGDVILHVFPETNVHKTLHHLSPQSSGDWQKQIQLLSSCVCLRSPDKWQQRQSQVSCCPNVKVTLTDTTHPVLFRILQYSSAYFCCFVLFVLYWIIACICMVLASLKWWAILSISLDDLVWEEAGTSYSF